VGALSYPGNTARCIVCSAFLNTGGQVAYGIFNCFETPGRALQSLVKQILVHPAHFKAINMVHVHGMLGESYSVPSLTYADRECAEAYVQLFDTMAFPKKLMENWRVVQATLKGFNIHEMLHRDREDPPDYTLTVRMEDYRKISQDTKNYRKEVKSGKLCGKARNVEADALFARYAKSMNDLESWTGMCIAQLTSCGG